MKRTIACFLLSLLVLSCKSKKKEPKDFFSVLNYLKAQVKQLDTSAHRFTRIVTIDSLSDTSAISLQDAKKEAQAFLSLPDIASDKKKDHYTETNSYDDAINNVLLTYTADNDDEEVRRETVMLEPDAQGNTTIKTILVNRMANAGDSTVISDMTWHVGQRFVVTTKVGRDNQPEKIRTLVVKWE